MTQKIAYKIAFVSDKDGDMHYDVMSAFQKSIRGSDVNAALHYLARLVKLVTYLQSYVDYL